MEAINKTLKRCNVKRCIGYQIDNDKTSTVYECVCEWTDGTNSNAYLVQGPPVFHKDSGLYDYEDISIAVYAEKPRIDTTKHNHLF